MGPESEQTQSSKLYYIPIVHTNVDMGKLGELIQRANVRKIGKSGWKQKLEIIEKYWMEIKKIVTNVVEADRKIRLYQDGLPVCGREVEIVKDLANAGSLNYQLLLDLMQKGATIMGTESADLLIKEYQLAKNMLPAIESNETFRFNTRQRDLSDTLLEKRDRFIADRINRTLCPKEIGILFIGMLHSLTKWLNKDILVINPTESLISYTKKGVSDEGG